MTDLRIRPRRQDCQEMTSSKFQDVTVNHSDLQTFTYCIPLRTKARAVKVKHDVLHIILQVNRI